MTCRIPVTLATNVIAMVAGLATPFVTNYQGFMACRQCQPLVIFAVTPDPDSGVSWFWIRGSRSKDDLKI